MDDSAQEITFDEKGQCSFCTGAIRRLERERLTGADGQKILADKLAAIRLAGRGKKYDCVIGVSGGVDSSYLVYKSIDWQLRPLLYHIDGGWNTEAANNNIKALVKYTGYDLEVFPIDWDEMRDLQLAFLRSGLANQDTPQDHAFFARLVDICMENQIGYFISGSNLATESILPGSWGYDALDEQHLSAIHRTFGQKPLKSFPLMPIDKYLIYNGQLAGAGGKMEAVKPLNWMSYNSGLAKKELMAKCGWQDYGRKHGESLFTKFFQNYYLPEKFGYDKRKAHLSSRIVAGEISREEALAELQRPLYDQNELAEDRQLILDKLGISAEQWAELMSLPTRVFSDYPNSNDFFNYLSDLIRRDAKAALKKNLLHYWGYKIKRAIKKHILKKAV